MDTSSMHLMNAALISPGERCGDKISEFRLASTTPTGIGCLGMQLALLSQNRSPICSMLVIGIWSFPSERTCGISKVGELMKRSLGQAPGEGHVGDCLHRNFRYFSCLHWTNKMNYFKPSLSGMWDRENNVKLIAKIFSGLSQTRRSLEFPAKQPPSTQ